MKKIITATLYAVFLALVLGGCLIVLYPVFVNGFFAAVMFLIRFVAFGMLCNIFKLGWEKAKEKMNKRND